MPKILVQGEGIWFDTNNTGTDPHDYYREHIAKAQIAVELDTEEEYLKNKKLYSLLLKIEELSFNFYQQIEKVNQKKNYKDFDNMFFNTLIKEGRELEKTIKEYRKLKDTKVKTIAEI